MPIPLFTAGEVLSAMRLNAMVQVVNDATAISESFGYPFEQVELNSSDPDHHIIWTWMFRYVPRNRYYKVRYVWSNRDPDAYITGKINGIQVFSDPAGGASGEFNHLIDLESVTLNLGLKEGAAYTLDIEAERGEVGGISYVRIIWAFNTNKSAYTPTIIQ